MKGNTMTPPTHSNDTPPDAGNELLAENEKQFIRKKLMEYELEFYRIDTRLTNLETSVTDLKSIVARVGWIIVTAVIVALLAVVIKGTG